MSAALDQVPITTLSSREMQRYTAELRAEVQAHAAAALVRSSPEHPAIVPPWSQGTASSPASRRAVPVRLGFALALVLAVSVLAVRAYGVAALVPWWVRTAASRPAPAPILVALTPRRAPGAAAVTPPRKPAREVARARTTRTHKPKRTQAARSQRKLSHRG